MAVDSASVSKKSVAGKEERIKSPQKKESKSEDVIPSTPGKRNKSPGIRVVGARIYDSVNGKTCHQCRQKTRDFVAGCKNQRNGKPCTIMYCHKCLSNRYGEKAEEVAALQEWNCPRCRDMCNCSICMKKRGQQPTGMLIQTAKATGFSSVSEMLLKGLECLNDKNVGDVVVSPKKEVALSPRKRGKENLFDGKVDANLPNHVDKKPKNVKPVNKSNADDTASMKILSQSPEKQKTKQGDLEDKHDSHGSEKKPKKHKRAKLDDMCNKKNDKENLKETTGHEDEKKPKKARKNQLEKNDASKKNEKESLKETAGHEDQKKPKKAKKNELEKNDASLARRTSPRKLKGSNKMSNQGENLNIGVALTKKVVKSLENDKQQADTSNTANGKNVSQSQKTEAHAEIPLPLGEELKTVAGMDICTEDAGNALQFLEFCSVFGKILEVKKGQAEHVLQDLLHGRVGRRGKFSLTVQFHIQLLSILLEEQGEECATLGPSCGKNSWFDALKNYLSESQSILKALRLDNFDKTADYESLNASQKLRLLNILCDEVLATEKVRNWMDDQNTQLVEKAKEARQKVTAAKDKEKSLKQKMKNDIAKALIAKHGDPLSISEHDAIVLRIKRKAEHAHAEVLESQGLFLKSNQTPNAVRIEPMFIGSGGDAYWQLSCSGKSNILRQNFEKGDSLLLDDKWFAIEDSGKEAIEKHISSLRLKRVKAPKTLDTQS